MAGTHRTIEEIETALEVLNDQLAEASHADRPSLEVAAQKLSDTLFEKKRQLEEASGAEANVEEPEELNKFLDALPRLVICNGIQKYVLIKISQQSLIGSDIYLVRGDPAAEYHYQCAMPTINELEKRNISAEVIGGGRIENRESENKLVIYGHSYQYGKADHAITAGIIKEEVGPHVVVSFGDFGY